MSALHGAVDDLPRCCLVGRVPETTELRRRLSEAMSGSGALCLLCGEEGIGKTRLAEEVAREARDLGIEVRWGRCLPETVAPPLWPWRQALLGHGAPLAAPAAPAVDAPLPALDFAALLEPHDAESRFRVLHAAVSQLARLTASRPLLLILEDLHLADEASLELLRLLARVMPEMPLLCLGTTRRVGDSVGPCGEQWTALLRESHLLPLRGLTPEAAAALLEQLPSAPLSVERVAQLCQYTDGNPYFLRGVARALASSSAGETRAAELPLPDDLRQTISARIAALPVTAQQLLRAAAILGEEFEVALAACAAGLTQAEQDAALRAAESDGVLVLLAPPPARARPFATRSSRRRSSRSSAALAGPAFTWPSRAPSRRAAVRARTPSPGWRTTTPRPCRSVHSTRPCTT